MSIQSEINRIANEVSTQTDLITQIVDALSDAGKGTVPTGTMQIIENGTYDVTEYASANVNVQSSGVELPELTNQGSAADLLNGKQMIDQDGNVVTGSMPDRGAFAVTVEIGEETTIPRGYHNGSGKITSSIPDMTSPGVAADLLSGKQMINQSGSVVTGTMPTRTSSNLTASGAKVTVPAGYYASQATKSVATATQATPSVSIDSNGKITASATQSAGYVAQGTKMGTKQLTTQAAMTITPSKSTQTAVAKNVYTTGAVTVSPIPSSYIQPSGTLNVTENGTHNVNNYASVNVNVALPSLTNPGAAANLEKGFELIDQNGNVVTGTHECEAGLMGDELPTLTNPGSAEHLAEGYELIDQDGNVVVGTHVCESGGGDGGSTAALCELTVCNTLTAFLLFVGTTIDESGDVAAVILQVEPEQTVTISLLSGSMFSVSDPFSDGFYTTGGSTDGSDDPINITTIACFDGTPDYYSLDPGSTTAFIACVPMW